MAGALRDAPPSQRAAAGASPRSARMAPALNKRRSSACASTAARSPKVPLRHERAHHARLPLAYAPWGRQGTRGVQKRGTSAAAPPRRCIALRVLLRCVAIHHALLPTQGRGVRTCRRDAARTQTRTEQGLGAGACVQPLEGQRAARARRPDRTLRMPGPRAARQRGGSNSSGTPSCTYTAAAGGVQSRAYTTHQAPCMPRAGPAQAGNMHPTRGAHQKTRRSSPRAPGADGTRQRG